MNSLPVLDLWLRLLGLLAIEILVVVLVTAWLSGRASSGRWRVCIWQAGLITAGLLTVAELSGLARQWGLRVQRPLEEQTSGSERVPARLREGFASEVEARLSTSRVTTLPVEVETGGASASEFVENNAGAVADPWVGGPVRTARSSGIRVPAEAAMEMFGLLVLALVWAAGAGMVLGRALLARVALWGVFGRRLPMDNPALLEPVRHTAGLLGLRRRVRVVQSNRLTGPIAFGVLRPTVVLPAGFWANHSRAAQEVMLAHELAHLGAYDPLWRSVADVVVAALWWHPAVWWLRRQLLAASEASADEASLLVAGGPKVLAECLVAIGRSAIRTPFAAQGLGMAGFRSQLGRRVELLLRLRDSTWRRMSWRRSLSVRLGGPITVGLIVISATTPIAPLTSHPENPMNTMRTCWTRSLAALALLGSLNESPAAAAGESPGRASNTAAQAEPGTPPQVRSDRTGEAERQMRERYGIGTSRAQGRRGPISEETQRLMMERYGMLPDRIPGAWKNRAPAAWESKLESIILDEVRFDGIPLPEVVRHLTDEARRLDPDKQGINFLLNPNSPPAAPDVDPVTGQLVPGAAPVDPSNILVRIDPPLRRLRLRDALEVIVKVADHPIAYSTEDYGVLFSIREPDRAAAGSGSPLIAGLTTVAPLSGQLAVSTFRIEKSALLSGLESAFDVRLEKMSTASNTASPGSSEARRIQAALKQLLVLLGVNMDVEGKSVFYNELTSVLMVRATMEDLEVVRAAVETLGGEPNPAFAPGFIGRSRYGAGRGFSWGFGGDEPGGAGFGGGIGGVGQPSGDRESPPASEEPSDPSTSPAATTP